MLLPDQTFPPDYAALIFRRIELRQKMTRSLPRFQATLEFYRTRPVDFICDWVSTVDPRNAGKPGMMVTMPFYLFERQRDMILFLMACLNGEANGLIEKSRDIGATWLCVGFSIWLWLFWPGVAVGWGSRKQDLVDRIGDMDSIFEKIRAAIRALPPEFYPVGFDPFNKAHMSFMRIVNPETGSTITGEVGDDIGRGGRKRIYFKDESAHYDHPELIEAALLENTRVQIDISSVSGPGNPFYRKRQAGVIWEPGQQVYKGKTNVFIFDWRDHPLKTNAWYKTARQKAVDEGLLHLFAQEVDRDYSAAAEGVCIPGEWVKSAIDAHVKLKFDDSGAWGGALDVGDEGGDRNGLCLRKGVVVKRAREWGDRDPGVTTRNTIGEITDIAPIDLQYDSVGLGVSVKAEFNRLTDEKLMPKGVRLIPWNAAASPLDPERNVIQGDKKSPINKDFFENLKGQGWFKLRLRFEKTHRAVTEGLKIPITELISIDSKSIPPGTLRALEAQLSQPVMTKSARLKFMIDKLADGATSPNMADALMMAFWPVKPGYDTTMSWVH